MRTNDLLVALAATPVLFATVPASSSIGQADLTSGNPIFTIKARKEENSSNPSSLSVTHHDDTVSLAIHASERRPNEWLLQAAATAYLEKQFESYFALGDNWDDQGAVIPVHRTLRMGRSLMRWAANNGFPCARTYLSPSGEIGLVWEKDKGYADLSLSDDGTLSFYVRDRSGLIERYSEDRVPLAEVPGDFWLLASTL